MATVKTRHRGDGTATYRVVWKAGGTRQGLWESETFAGKADAARFRRDVDLAGQRWPDGWVKGAGYAGGTQPESAPTPPFVEFARGYLRDLTGITPATRHRYDRQVLLVTEQLHAVLRQQPTVANIEDVHIRRWVNTREAAGARPKTIANYHGLLEHDFPTATPPTPRGTATSCS